MSVLFIFLGITLLAFSNAIVALCGVLALVLYMLMDKVDGELARYYQRFSIVGVYLDELGHNFAPAGVFIGLGLHLAWGDPNGCIFVLSATMIGSFSVVMIRHAKFNRCDISPQE